MALNLNGGRMVPDYGSDAPVVPLEKGNIDITANGYAGHLKSAYGSMMIATDGKMYTLIPKVDPIGNPMEDDVGDVGAAANDDDCGDDVGDDHGQQ